MKIAVVGINYSPEVTGIGIYTTQMCESLVKKGYSVTVFTGFPYYPFGYDFHSWYKYNGINLSRFFMNENINGVNVKRANLYKPAQPNIIRRIIHESSFCLMITTRMILDPAGYNVIFCISPPLLLGLSVFFVSLIRKTPFIIHVKDLQPDAAVEMGMLKKSFFTRLLYGIERFVYKKADMVLTLSAGMRDKIIAKDISPQKVILFYDWVDAEKIKPQGKDNPFSRKYGLNNKFVVLHAGNMGEKQDMHVIMESADALKNDDSICFLLVGRGTKRRFVEDYIKQNSLRNVLLLDVQPDDTLSDMFSACDVSLITQTKKVRNIVMPSKVFGPAVVTRPIIVAATDDCEISCLAREYNFALVVAPEDHDGLVRAIFSLKEDNSLAKKLGENGRSFMISQRSMDSVIKELEEDVLSRYNKQ